MLLDKYEIAQAIFQIQYADAYELWDKAGVVGRRLCRIWPGLKIQNAQPQTQVFQGPNCTVNTAFNLATVTITGARALDGAHIDQLAETLKVWVEELGLKEFTRVSTRVVYARKFDSIERANEALREMGLVQWPSEKVFDQPIEGKFNTFDLQYRFEDSSSFALLRLKSEQVNLSYEIDKNLADENKISPKLDFTKNHIVIDFDKGTLGTISASKFRMEDWIKGFQHVLKRDLGKVVGARR